ncbi:malto-oligosyltrehalose trehalohydrolase [Paenarthrobacter sp. Z7-10]|uniref:malto-oligosyltrehalose trehalohydrolase n=1 Tax=Paenarthrobacter sp. Z7-10 TaxID=2787635 RepID=UPI0022A96047|nr:malto-oligosyltrehalose trehalohydrolase [Paenarthrobacter sp. Z7-10]MCZ2404100.1 malto-oligosyltrehalose trehalohydrolase [Paenarthrobacter sp. Z7-10]
MSRREIMSRFDVWAPDADTVAVLADGQTLPMDRLDGGWWGLQDGSAGGGSASGGSAKGGAPSGAEVDYGYLLDGSQEPLPDPRSRRQPHGVHGLSRTFDSGGYLWGDRKWTGRPLAGGSIYELHIGTFTPAGTLDAAVAKLDYLVDLGVDFIELLPVNAFNGTHNWGYDGVLWYAVQEEYGGPEAYQRLVDAAHQRGLGVIQDVVYNHLGPSGNYLPRFGPYLTQGSANTWGDSLNLDGPDSDEVRRYIVDNALMWFRDFHVDGLRLDAVHALRDTRAVHILEELATATDALAVRLGKPLFLVAESDLNDPSLIRPRPAHGLGLSAQWSDDFHHAAHVNVTGETEGYYADFASIGALAKVLSKGFYHDGSYSSFRGRHHGRPLDLLHQQTWQLVVCIQNHDQIGNRATGDRLSATLDYNHLALAAVLNLASPFTPMLFMGEEYGARTPWQFFTSHPEPELGKATAEGRIAEFARMGWDPAVVPDPQDPETFRRSKLDWSEAAGEEQGRLLALYRELLALRRSTPELTAPSFAAVGVEYSEPERWLVLHRGDSGGGISVAFNFSDQPRRIPAGYSSVLLATADGVGHDGDGVLLPAWSAAVLRD